MDREQQKYFKQVKQKKVSFYCLDNMAAGMFLAMFFVCLNTVAHAATFTVSQDGTGQFKTIQACANTAIAGDTCLVMPGQYNELLSPKTSGKAGSPITFKANPGVKVAGVNISNKPYIVIDGFEIANLPFNQNGIVLTGGANAIIQNNYIHDLTGGNTSAGVGILLTSSSGAQVLNNKIERTSGIGIRMNMNVGVTSNDVVIKDNTVSYSGYQINGAVGIQIAGNNLLIEHNDISHVADFIYLSKGSNVVIRNNYLHHVLTSDWSSFPHIDGVQGYGSDILIENNIMESVAELTGNVHFALFGNDGMLPFSAAEFISPMTPEALIAAIKTKIGVDVPIVTTSITALNTLLLSTTLYESMPIVPDEAQPVVTQLLSGKTVNSYSLREANRMMLEANLPDETPKRQNAVHATVRYNKVINIDSAFVLGQYGYKNIYVYNNTVYKANLNTGAYNTLLSFASSSSSVGVLNNIFYDGTGKGLILYSFDDSSKTKSTVDYNLAYSSICQANCGRWNYGAILPNYTDLHSIFNKDPLFNDVSTNDLSLKDQVSPGQDKGGALTTVASSDTNVGTDLIVNNAMYFQFGDKMLSKGVQPDWIAVGDVNNVVQIQSINYETNTITLASPIARSSGDQVWLFKDSAGRQVLYGSAPDLGAIEFGQASQATGSGDVSGDKSVTMFDASLVMRYTLGASLTNIQKQAADINGDTRIDTVDVMSIVRKAMGF